jgi:hypothetical protein
MSEDVEPRPRRRKKLWLTLAAVLVLLLAVVLVPPYISISRYKSQITQLMSRSLGRPVRLSSVELRLLPWPGFELTDLTVDEDPAYGAEPVLHANSVRASIRLMSLWRGKLELDSIRVDEASLNLVRTATGAWNVDPILRSAAAGTGASHAEANHVRLPYLAATNSRVNFKRGVEKLPYSLVSADLSFWQENPGDWRLRVRAQPSRTDTNLDMADTGTVRMEARLHAAPELHQMPLHVDMEWRDAQLGQLSRLLFGSDPGWRGDLRGEMHVDGTPEAAKITSRLRAEGVHRAEFAPADPMDFDANCGFVYHYSARTVENLVCDSPVGDGKLHLEGQLPGNAPPRLTLNLENIASQVGLDTLRTVRRGIADDLEAGGTLTGKIVYDPAAAAAAAQAQKNASSKVAKAKAKKAEAPPMALTGTLNVKDFELSGGPLDQPLHFADFSLNPAQADASRPVTLAAETTVPAGGAQPLAVSFELTHRRYAVALHGAASLKRLRQFAQLAGLPDAGAINDFAGDPPMLDVSAQGPWIPAEENRLAAPAVSVAQALVPAVAEAAAGEKPEPSDVLTGTVTFRNVQWSPASLSNRVEIASATLQLGADGAHWEPVEFSFGALKGTAVLQMPVHCKPATECVPVLDVHLAQLEPGVLQTTLLGSHDKTTMLSSLIARFTTSAPPVWPRLNVRLKADSAAFGAVTLKQLAASVEIKPDQAKVTSLEATLLGGALHLSGTVDNGQKPNYALEGALTKADPAALCKFLELRCTGGPVDVSGKFSLAGFTQKDLSASTTGTLHVEWRRGGMLGRLGPSAKKAVLPAPLARFDRWTADADIANATVVFGKNQILQGSRKATVKASIDFGEPPQMTFAAPEVVERH